MAQKTADRQDVDFVLHEQPEISTLCEKELFREFEKRTVDLIVSEARALAIKAILPTFKSGDPQKEKDAAFFAGQIYSARFFIFSLLPATLGKMEAILAGGTSLEEIPDSSFGSK